LLRAKELDRPHPDAQALAEPTARDIRPRGVHGGSTSAERIGRTTAQIGERKRGGRRVGQDVELERGRDVEDSCRKLTDQIFTADPRQIRADAGDQGRLENAQPQEVGQARSFARAIESEQVPRVLPMGVVEGVVRVLLIVERSDARALESGAEPEPPHERALHVACEGPRGDSVRRECRMKVVIGGTERHEPAPLPLLQHHPGNDAERRGRGGDRAVVLETDRHVKPDGLAGQAAIVGARIEAMVGRSIADAMS
jgi:hypothetical protein